MAAASPQVRPADPAARRRALILVAAGAIAGGLLIAAQGWYRGPLRAWLLDDPAQTESRARWLLAAAGAMLVLPLVAFAAYAWRLGARTIAHREFPPPGHAVISDTKIARGDAAISHGRGLKVVAMLLLLGAAIFVVLVWRLGALLAR